jgi:hypothetical protein
MFAVRDIPISAQKKPVLEMGQTSPIAALFKGISLQ